MLVDSSSYVQDRERRRKSQLILFLVLLVGFGTVLVLRGGTAGQVFTGAAVLYVGFLLLVSQPRALPFVSRRTRPQPWQAQIPVFVYQNQGVELQRRVRPTIELVGKLETENGDLKWSPGPNAARLGAVDLIWQAGDVQGAKVKNVWGLFPTSLLSFQTAEGRQVDLWVRIDDERLRSLLTS